MPEDFNRNPDRQSEATPFVWEHESEDMAIVVEKEEDENCNLYKPVEKVGGYTEHEIGDYVEDPEIAVSRAESYMKNGEIPEEKKE